MIFASSRADAPKASSDFTWALVLSATLAPTALYPESQCQGLYLHLRREPTRNKRALPTLAAGRDRPLCGVRDLAVGDYWRIAAPALPTLQHWTSSGQGQIPLSVERLIGLAQDQPEQR